MTVVSPWLAPDPVLPQRDVLLDADAMRDRLSRVLARFDTVTIDHCERVRVNYELGKSLRVLYRVRTNGTQQYVASRMFREGRSASAFAMADSAGQVGSRLRAVAHDPALETIYWSFPNDRKIKALPLLAAPTSDVAGFVPGGWDSSELVAYAPEKTATAACINQNGRVAAFVKVAAADQTERDCSFYQALRSTLPENDPHLMIPAPLGFSALHRMLWLEVVRGRRVGEDGDWTGDARAMGSAVARFHQCDVPEAQAFTRFDADHLARAGHVVSSVRPDLADATAALLEDFRAHAVPGDVPVCLHGDLHPKNALVCGSRVALLDVEDLTRGPAACDIGSFLGALEYYRLADALPQTMYEERGAAFVAGYEAVACLPDPQSLAWHTAASLFVERAVRSVTRIRPSGLSHLPALLDRASEILARGLDG